MRRVDGPEDEGGAGELADLAGAGGDVLEGLPALGEQREAAFAHAAGGPDQRIPGAGVDVGSRARSSAWRSPGARSANTS